MKTKERILAKALEMMNESGIENVSTYDIARALNIRQSNITYYFPTKADIINALFKRMVEEANQLFESIESSKFSFRYYYRSLDHVMQIHLRYRFLFMNYATLITADPELNQYLINVLQTRFPQFEGIIKLLDANGYIEGKEMLTHSSSILLMQNMLIIYWVQESAIYNADKSDEEKRKHYLKLYFQTFIPYLTPKGKENLLPLL